MEPQSLRERIGREIDRTIAVLAPGMARRRLANRNAVMALYEAGEPGRTRRKSPRPEAGDISIARAGSRIRDWARDLEQNYDIASGALDVLTANTVGLGVHPLPMARLVGGEPADEFNHEVRRLWRDWIKNPDVTGAMELGGLQSLYFRSAFRDGDGFVRQLIGTVPGLKRQVKDAVPYWIQPLEGDFVPLDLEDPKKNLIQGIEHDQWWRPTAIHVYKQHPAGLQPSREVMPIPADRMVHTKITQRLHQVRGISIFHALINRLDDIREIDESERIAARVAAALTAVVIKGEPEDYEAPADGNVRTMSVKPGTILDNLRPGEDVKTITSNRPNNALIPFRDSQLRSAAAGFGVSFSSLSKNYNGTYSAQRQELVEQYVQYGVIWNAVVRPTCQRIYQGFIDAAIAARLLNIGGVDPLTVYDAKHSRPPLVWIDPKKEAEALKVQRKQGWKSDSQIMQAAGDDPEETWRQISRDQDTQEEIGIVVGDEAAAIDPTAD